MDIHQGSDKLETRGAVRIKGLWEHQTDAVIDAKLSNNDVDTYRFEAMAALLV